MPEVHSTVSYIKLPTSFRDNKVVEMENGSQLGFELSSSELWFPNLIKYVLSKPCITTTNNFLPFSSLNAFRSTY